MLPLIQQKSSFVFGRLPPFNDNFGRHQCDAFSPICLAMALPISLKSLGPCLKIFGFSRDQIQVNEGRIMLSILTPSRSRFGEITR
jgi:hypothetical protein